MSFIESRIDHRSWLGLGSLFKDPDPGLLMDCPSWADPRLRRSRRRRCWPDRCSVGSAVLLKKERLENSKVTCR